MKKTIKKQATMREKGQVLVVVALTIMMLIGIIGLAIDTGYVYVSYSRLRRAVDAAALAATGEFKRNYTHAAMTASAMQQLRLNGVITTADANNPNAAVLIETCSTNAGDPELCPLPDEPAKKMVRVTVTQNVPMFFMSVWGFNRIPITIVSLSQAASIDLVLLIQNSEKMADIASQINKDPSVCNPHGCHPFEEVKTAALDFVNNMMYFPYDRVSVVTFNKTATVNMALSDQVGGNTITQAVNDLEVFNPPPCVYHQEDLEPDVPPGHIYPRTAPFDGYNGADPQNPCRLYSNAGLYAGGFSCPMHNATNGPLLTDRTSDNDPSWCGTTNPAAGLAMAGNHLQGAYNFVGSPAVPITPIVVRDDALWVILLLATGAPNSAQDDFSQPLCPPSTRGAYYHLAGCRDQKVIERHCYLSTDKTCMDASFDVTGNGTYIMHSTHNPTNYDAYDRAFDMVDIQVANSVLIFTIGLGPQVQAPAGDLDGLAPGETFLKYAAKVGGGIYRPSATSAELQAIFLEIANKIATKLTQ